MDLSKLKEPFPPQDIDWRVQRSGFKNDKPWLLVIAYVDNRAIQNRLDEVCDPENWQNVFEIAEKGAICGIGIKIGDEWVWKYDGAEESDIEPFKGMLSGSMKRAAATGWGIGRYLYGLEATFAIVTDNGSHGDKVKKHRDDKDGEWVRWNPPTLPPWALPNDHKPQATPPLAQEAIHRETCGPEPVPLDGGPPSREPKSLDQYKQDIIAILKKSHLSDQRKADYESGLLAKTEEKQARAYGEMIRIQCQGGSTEVPPAQTEVGAGAEAIDFF